MPSKYVHVYVLMYVCYYETVFVEHVAMRHLLYSMVDMYVCAQYTQYV